MSTSSSTNAATIAFFGATGGCTLATLTNTLLSTKPYRCIALARTPQKLTSLLRAQAGITAEILDERLTIIPGDARDKEAVKRVLTSTATSQRGTQGGRNDGASDGSAGMVDMIVSGLGAAPKFQWSLWQPVTLDNPTICQDAARTLVEALEDLQGGGGLTKGMPSKKKPLLTFISTTGISSGPEDVPLGLRWLYRHLLFVPHEDKKAMEAIYQGEGAVERGQGKVFGSVVGVRASLLAGTGNAKDVKQTGSVRVGREKEPAVGYWIKRADVGRWMFTEVIEKGGKGWEGEMVTVTY